MFFVLSGFLITGILFDTRDDPHRIWNFYLRRTLRIFPLYYGVMVLLILIYPIFLWNWNSSWLMWPAYLGNFTRYIHPHLTASTLRDLGNAQLRSRRFPDVVITFGHFWSLCVEEQFYLAWPWVVFWVRDRKRLIYICVAFVVLCPVMRVIAFHTASHNLLNEDVLYRATPFRLDALLLGGLIALLRRGPNGRQVLTVARVGFASLSAMALLWLTLVPTARPSRAYVYPYWEFTWGLVFIDLFSACLIVQALQVGSVTFRIFNHPALRWLGRISYGLYVYHDILHSVIFEHLQHFQRVAKHTASVTALLSFPLTVLIAWASYRWFEKPFIGMKERYTRV